MVCSYCGMLFGNKKEWSNDTFYNMDKSWMKEASHKGHIVYEFIYMKCPGQSVETVSSLVTLGLRGAWE